MDRNVALAELGAKPSASSTYAGSPLRHGPILDKPAAGLLCDLKARGLLDDTLVLWTTEFGRMPTFQKGAQGRDR